MSPLPDTATSVGSLPIVHPHDLPRGHAQGIRHRNRGVVLRTLMQQNTASRADLARLTGLARPTISDVVRDLLGEGLILETGQSHETRPGKPAVMLEFAHDAVQVIVIDLSAPENVTAALARTDGHLLHRVSRPAPYDAADVASLATELVQLSTRPILGVGVGTPLGSSAAADEMRSRLAAVVGAPVRLIDDADLVAESELRFGHGEADFLLVRVGARIGTAIRNGIHRGDESDGSTARELAHVIAGGDPHEECGCGRLGCVHAWASAPALARRLAGTDPAARRRILADAGTRLGTSLSVIASALDLPTVVLSGPATVLEDDFISAASDAVEAASHTLFESGPVRVRRSEVADAVLRGAAVRVVAAELGVR